MAQNLIDALKERNIQFVVAPYEADAQVRTHFLAAPITQPRHRSHTLHPYPYLPPNHSQLCVSPGMTIIRSLKRATEVLGPQRVLRLLRLPKLRS